MDFERLAHTAGLKHPQLHQIALDGSWFVVIPVLNLVLHLFRQRVILRPVFVELGWGRCQRQLGGLVGAAAVVEIRFFTLFHRALHGWRGVCGLKKFGQFREL